MCIRDRIIAIEPSPRNVECLRRNFPKEIAEGRVVVYPKGAVSYTHLRAHETVLDLVCRLLLEKKTTYIQYIIRHYLIQTKQITLTTNKPLA